MKFPGIKGLRPHLAGVCVVLTLAVGNGRAGDNDADLRSLLEQQSKQIAEQQKTARGFEKALDAAELTKVEAQPTSAHGASLNEGTVQKIVTEYLEEKDRKEKEEAKSQQKTAEDEGYKVGTILNNATVRWDPANGFRLETPNKDFTFHAGYRFQLDQALWTQTSASLKAAQLGDLQDGTFFRRSRPSFDGTMWEVVEFNVELALEQVTNGVPNFDEAWVGLKSIPVIGAVQVGHMKVPQGLEGDMYSSSKAMTFLERSAYTDAFYENFATGVRLTNSFLDQLATYAAMAYFQDNNPINGNNNSGVFFGDGVAGYTGRITALPLWENDGRCFLHLGASATWRNNSRPGQDLADPRQDRFRA